MEIKIVLKANKKASKANKKNPEATKKNRCPIHKYAAFLKYSAGQASVMLQNIATT